MSHSTHHIKQSDLLPVISGTCQDETLTPVDLALASYVTFNMRFEGATTPVIATYATITNASLGTVEYAWASGDTATAGTFEAEFEVRWQSGKRQTFPNRGNLRVSIEDDIA